MAVKKIRFSGNNEQQVSAEIDTDEQDETSLQVEPDNSNADQPDDTYDDSLFDNTILPNVKDRVVFIRRGYKRMGNVEQFILELGRVGKIQRLV